MKRIEWCLLLLVASCGPASALGCDLSVEQWLSTEFPSLKSWEQIYDSFHKFGARCDDGIFGEGYSDAVVQQFAYRWSDLSSLKPLIERDLKFDKWVLAHINATTDCVDVARLQNHASTDCPGDLQGICREISDRTHLVLAAPGFACSP